MQAALWERLHSGVGPLCSAIALLVAAAAARLGRMSAASLGGVTAAALGLRFVASASNLCTPATLRVLVRLEVAHVHFVFLLVCHMSFQLFVFLVWSCVSRAEELPSAGDLLAWNQVIELDQFLFRTLLPLSSTLAGFGVLSFLRRTHATAFITLRAKGGDVVFVRRSRRGNALNARDLGQKNFSVASLPTLHDWSAAWPHFETEMRRSYDAWLKCEQRRKCLLNVAREIPRSRAVRRWFSFACLYTKSTCRRTALASVRSAPSCLPFPS